MNGLPSRGFTRNVKSHPLRNQNRVCRVVIKKNSKLAASQREKTATISNYVFASELSVVKLVFHE